MPKHRTVIFVHGCFWHSHDCREGSVVAKTRAEFWAAKRLGNVSRDANHLKSLQNDGWEVVTIWECETKDPDRLKRILYERFHQKGSAHR